MGLLQGDVEDGGEELSLVPQLEVPGSGHPLHPLYLSDALRERLVTEGLTDEQIDALLTPPPVKERPQDDSYPLSCYFISTSHNTYLLSRQLLGTSSPVAYTHVITKGCRCVEIDAWDSYGDSGEPIVTHGLTWTESTPFRDVCEAIGAAVTDDQWPLMISLECHANAKTQLRMVEIMKETWGNKLVDQSVENFDRNVPPSALKGRILLIVEWYPPEGKEEEPGEEFTSETDSASDHGEEETGIKGFMERLTLKKKESKEKKGKKPKPKIIPELAELGVYAQSVKPKKDWLTKDEPETPLHLFINISESAMGSIIPSRAQQFIARGSKRQVRIYPKGTRIESNNYNPVPYWRAGGQICAQNWQRFDKGMQLTRAMFEGTDGWLLKPPSLLGNHRRGDEVPPAVGMQTLSVEIFGISSVPLRQPLPEDEKENIYILAQLFHEDGDRSWRSPTVAGQLSAERNKVDLTYEAPQTFSWDYNANRDLTFLRILVVHNRTLEMDTKLGIHSINIADHNTGLQLLRLQDPNGNFTNASLLVSTKIADTLS